MTTTKTPAPRRPVYLWFTPDGVWIYDARYTAHAGDNGNDPILEAGTAFVVQQMIDDPTLTPDHFVIRVTDIAPF